MKKQIIGCFAVLVISATAISATGKHHVIQNSNEYSFTDTTPRKMHHNKNDSMMRNNKMNHNSMDSSRNRGNMGNSTDSMSRDSM